VKAADSEKDLVEILTITSGRSAWALSSTTSSTGNDGEREDAPEYASLKIDEVDGLMVSGFAQDMRAGRWSIASPLRLKAD